MTDGHTDGWTDRQKGRRRRLQYPHRFFKNHGDNKVHPKFKILAGLTTVVVNMIGPT